MPLETGKEVTGAEPVVATETETPKWMAQNAGDNKTNERLRAFGTTDEISNAYLKASDELASFKDGKIFVPGDDASDEEKRAFLTSRGVPEESGNYKKVDSKLPDGVGYTEEENASFNEMAFKSAWSEAQYSKFKEWEETTTLSRIEKHNKILENGKVDMMNNFKKEWGSEYDANLNLMHRGVKNFGGDNFLIKLGAAGNLPEVINFLVEKGRSDSDDTFLDSAGGGPQKGIPGQISYPSMKGM